jgi:hypothetical protein
MVVTALIVLSVLFAIGVGVMAFFAKDEAQE